MHFQPNQLPHVVEARLKRQIEVRKKRIATAQSEMAELEKTLEQHIADQSPVKVVYTS